MLTENSQIPNYWHLVFGVASVVLLVTAAVFLAFGKGSPQPWIPSVARPCSHDVIYEQDVLELDYEDVGVQTEPYDPYISHDEAEEDIAREEELAKEQKEKEEREKEKEILATSVNSNISAIAE